MILLIASIVVLFGTVIGVVVVFQPRAEDSIANNSVDDAWASAGLASIRMQGYELYQIVPTQSWTKAEFLFVDEYHREMGRYIATGMKSGTIQCGRRTIGLFIQGSGINRTRYAGQVGGSSDNSIIIRDGDHVVAEVWRMRIMPVIEYRIASAGRNFRMCMSSWRPTALGTVEEGEKQVAAFRRPRVLARNAFAAFDEDIAEELKVLFMSLLLLR